MSPYRHPGIDLRAAIGTEILSPADGRVLKIVDSKAKKNAPGCGNSIKIHHSPSGIITRYCHLTEVKVKKGETVTQGQVIGTSGIAGTGAHLHYEVYDQGTDYAQDNRVSDHWKNKPMTSTSDPLRYLSTTNKGVGEYNKST